jgi:arabinan endo-1,5-alpha-L-arabinosidase
MFQWDFWPTPACGRAFRLLQVSGMNLSDIQLRDPFVLTDTDAGRYVLFGTTDADPWVGPAVGFDCYESTDLEQWRGPKAAFRPPPGFWSRSQYWAPEVHRYGDRWYLFATFGSDDGTRRGTAVLVSDRVDGPYAPWSRGPVTPPDWLALDGTLYVDPGGQPWMVFCHEWIQINDGEVCALPLTEDLRQAAGDPIVLFRASEAAWTRPVRSTDGSSPGFVTDGPFLRTTDDGKLTMLWSSFSSRGYALGIARSSTGGIAGPWEQEPDPLWQDDGGHGMLFRTVEGELRLALHSPNITPDERAVFLRVIEDDRHVGSLTIA